MEVIADGDLSGLKARIALMLALGSGLGNRSDTVVLACAGADEEATTA